MPIDPRRRVPRTDVVLADPRLVAAVAQLGRTAVKRVVGRVLDQARAGDLEPDSCADEVVRLLTDEPPGPRPLLNATGVVLHTNLGRAPLAPAAVAAVNDAVGYVDVEFDLATGQRARRGRRMLDAVRRAVPDAGDVHVVNNGAGALVLATTALAAGREIVVSRGEMVEIGDGFRLPDLITSTGARLREVGTTNRVALADYAAAIGPDTGAVLKVHPSNFRIEGFTSSVGVGELAGLGVPVIADIGSGLLAPCASLPDEPDVASTLRAGATVVTCSGDKLLGGPQAGLLCGDTDTIARLRHHPLARALRVDKLTIAALEATLDGPPTPVRQYLAAQADGLRARCELLADALGGTVVESVGAVGGGAAPGHPLPGWAVALPAEFAQRLRCGRVPVIARIERDRCLLDLRCIPPDQDEALRDAVLAVTAG
ncbi:MAG TPA: L-seryl-tRNA(Sec) selenium transferase [Jatrophihabitans sp.]|nr:L-seryl-tRNA(Sec) selenium transferase [Jatrophihabitans sp.]